MYLSKPACLLGKSEYDITKTAGLVLVLVHKFFFTSFRSINWMPTLENTSLKVNTGQLIEFIKTNSV